MARTISTDWFDDYLKNGLTPGTVVLLRAWLAEACRINGDNFSAICLAEALATYVVIAMDEKDLGKAPRDSSPLPTPEDIALLNRLQLAHAAGHSLQPCSRRPE